MQVVYIHRISSNQESSFYGNLILIYMWVFIIWFRLSLLSLLLYSKCCDHSFLFGFSCLLLYLTEVTAQSIDLYPLFSTTKMVQYYFFLEAYVLFSVKTIIEEQKCDRELNQHLPGTDTSVGLLSAEVIGDCSSILTPVSIYERKSEVMKYHFLK